MYIEDLIIALTSRNLTMNPYDSKLIYSFCDQISKGSGFTEKQQNLSVKILKRQVVKLNAILNQEISPFLENPVFKLTQRTVSAHKHMSIIPHLTLEKAIKVEFPFNDSLLSLIRSQKHKLNHCQWDSDQKSWIFSLDERSLTFLRTVAIAEHFTMDSEFEQYQTQIQDIENNIEQYIPMVGFDGKNLKFLNISSIIPQPSTSNIIENLFNARKFGIFTWDESVEDTSEWKNSTQIVKEFLQTDPRGEFNLNLEEHTIFSLGDIIKYLSPVLFVIPSGTELEKLKESMDFLKSVGVHSNEISVLFRLPNETGEEFNNYVRTENLNSPVDDLTKVVFISSKVPKTIIEKKIKFNCVINFNFYSIHYSIRNLIKWHHNVIHIVENSKQKVISFGNM